MDRIDLLIEWLPVYGPWRVFVMRHHERVSWFFGRHPVFSVTVGIGLWGAMKRRGGDDSADEREVPC